MSKMTALQFFMIFKQLGPWSWGARLDSIWQSYYNISKTNWVKLPNFSPIHQEMATELGDNVTNLTAFIVWWTTSTFA